MDLNFLFGVAAFVGALLVFRGFIVLLPTAKGRSFEGYVARGIVAWGTFGVLRFGFWDIMRTLIILNLGPDAWSAVLGVAFVAVNVPLNLLFLYGCYEFFRAKQMLVPPEDRHDWPLLAAVFYPSDKCMTVRISRRVVK